MELPLTGVAKNEWWESEVSSSGSHLWLIHKEDFGYSASTPPPKSEIEVLDTNTRAVLGRLKTKVVNVWSAGDDEIACANPHTGSDCGVLSIDGVWNPINFSWDTNCPNFLTALPHQMLAAFGCGKLRILTIDGKLKWKTVTGDHDAITEVVGKERFMAVRADRRQANPFDSGFKSRPSRIIVYDLDRLTDAASIPVSASLVNFAISKNGTVATVEGTMLKVFASQGRVSK